MSNAITLFLALCPDETFRQSLWKMLAGLREKVPDRVRWIPPRNYHVTMKFIGAITEDDLPEVVEKVKNAVSKLAQPDVLLQHALLFPNAEKPRVIASMVQPNRALQVLYDVIEDALDLDGIKPNKHPFLPHLSVARVRNFNCPQFEPYELALPEITIPTLTLLQSISTGHGVTYKPLTEMDLLKP